jgi:uncharacterized protein
MPKLIEVIIDSVRISLTNAQRIVILKEAQGIRYLPIWIGPYAAEAITIALQEIEVARPETHDLMKNLVQRLKGHLKQIEIISLKEEVFYGNLVLESDGKTMQVDSRPSDALALAVRFHVPIFIHPDVMASAGITPEGNLLAENPPEAVHPGHVENPPEEVGSNEQDHSRLTVFEEFLDKLNPDDEEHPKDEELPPDDSPEI